MLMLNSDLNSCYSPSLMHNSHNDSYILMLANAIITPCSQSGSQSTLAQCLVINQLEGHDPKAHINHNTLGPRKILQAQCL